MWFEVDRDGLAKLLERRGKEWIFAELLQNAWDAPGVTTVQLSATPVLGRPLCQLEIIDDSPEGFSDLTHAFTLFGESVKKADPSLRGRFNLGEKLVLALCQEAEISTTKGTVRFGADGQRTSSRVKRESGTRFSATVKLTRDELADALQSISTFIPPDDINTYINSRIMLPRESLREFDAVLPTELADAGGVLRRTRRKTQVRVFEPLPGMVGRIYEMGIPIVETGDTFDVDIAQKVPLSLERDSVTPAYLRDLRVAVLNSTVDLLTADRASAVWVNDAIADSNVDPRAVSAVVTSRFGDRVVTYDPSDVEANSRAVAQGYRVLPGGSFNKEQWENIRLSGVVQPAGRVMPTPKPFSSDGDPAEIVERTPAMEAFAGFCQELARRTMDVEIRVDFFRRFGSSAAYGNRRLCFNVSDLKRSWFEQIGAAQVDLVIHELGHEYESNHLSDRYYKALTRLAGKTTMLALAEPQLFELDSYMPVVSQQPGM